MIATLKSILKVNILYKSQKLFDFVEELSFLFLKKW